MPASVAFLGADFDQFNRLNVTHALRQGMPLVYCGMFQRETHAEIVQDTLRQLAEVSR
jgi:hypothetical protein